MSTAGRGVIEVKIIGIYDNDSVAVEIPANEVSGGDKAKRSDATKILIVKKNNILNSSISTH